MEKKPYIFNGQRLTKDEYNKMKFDRFLVTVPKGDRDKIKSHAENAGQSLNAYILTAISDRMEREG